MHVTRPKSSKGRSRPVPCHNQTVEDVSYHGTPITPCPPSTPHEEARRPARPQSTTRQSSSLSMDEVAELLEHIPTPPAMTLNRYRVLPSIDRRPSSGYAGIACGPSDHHTVPSRLCCQGQRASSARTRAGTQRHPETDSDVLHVTGTELDDLASSSAGHRGSLLLAIRSPSGRRFQQYFDPSDTLLAVLAAAEARYETKYEGGVVETMDVSRVSFTDLTQTLAQCGIQNRTVLCISQEEHRYMDIP